MEGDFGGGGVIALVGDDQFEDPAGIGGGLLGVAGHLQGVAAAVQQGVAEGQQLRRVLRRGEEFDAFVEAAAGFVVIGGDQAAVRAGEGQPLEGGGILLVRELS